MESIFDQDPIQVAICSNLSFEEVGRFLWILKIKELECPVQIYDHIDDKFVTIPRINRETIRAYQFIKKFGLEGSLLEAIFTSDIIMVKILIEIGADPESGSYNGLSSFQLAINRSNVEIVKILLDSGATVNAFALILAVRTSKPEIVQLLLKSSKSPLDLNFVEAIQGRTALSLASIYGATEMVKMLLEAGADPNILDIYGKTALDNAKNRGYSKIAEMLIAAGAH